MEPIARRRRTSILLRKNDVFLTAASLAIVSPWLASRAWATSELPAPTPRPFALVELFTSEGCSSCPPADENLARLTEEADAQGSRVFTLGRWSRGRLVGAFFEQLLNALPTDSKQDAGIPSADTQLRQRASDSQPLGFGARLLLFESLLARLEAFQRSRERRSETHVVDQIERMLGYFE